MTETIELTDWKCNGTPVRVPHDAMRDEPRSADAPTGSAGAYFPGGTYTYQLTLPIPANWANKHVTLEFEGVMGHTLVLANDLAVATHAYGYTEFTANLDSVIANSLRNAPNPDAAKLRLAVVANNSHQPASRWYAGSGIYRPVRLIIQDRDYIQRDSLKIVTEHINPAQIRVRMVVHGTGTPYIRIERPNDPDGVAVAGNYGTNARIGVPDAHLWSADDPYLYRCHVILRDEEGQVLDELSQPFGIRILDWVAHDPVLADALADPDAPNPKTPSGLLVNGTPVKLRGTCVHHDNGILGATDLPAASRRKVTILKSWGFNAIRSAHNPLSRSMLDACDELGMYVIDEFADMWYQPKNPCDYAGDFERYHAADITAMVRKDRNHPSVVMYSIGNENAEPHEELGILTARLLANTVRRHDPTRPVTAGVNAAILFAASLGIDSFNGGGEEQPPVPSTSSDATWQTSTSFSESVQQTNTATSAAPSESNMQPTNPAVTSTPPRVEQPTMSPDVANASPTKPSNVEASAPAKPAAPEPVPAKPAPAPAPNASLAFNTYVQKMGDVMEFMAGSWPVGRAVAPYLDELDIAGYNYGTRRYRPDLRRVPNRLVFGAETMPYDLPRNWQLVESDPRIIGDFMWTGWDYLGECSLAAWSDDPTPVNKPFPWLVADTGALDLIGDPTGEAALARVVWKNNDQFEGATTEPPRPAPRHATRRAHMPRPGSAMSPDPLLFVRPADLPHPYTAPWRGTNSVPCWSWRGAEGNQTVAEVYTRAPIAKLYLNGRHLATRRVRDFHADFRVRYEPGELVAVACTPGGLELGRTTLRSTEGPISLRILEESRYEDVAFFRIDAVDAAGTIEGSCNRTVSLQVAGAELLAFGSAAQRSECSYGTGVFPLRYGRALAVVRLTDAPFTLIPTFI